MATILVTGGAGYIGSHACHALARAGHLPVTFDDLSTGWAEAVRFGPLAVGGLADAAALEACFATHRPEAVMHFAARSDVAESVRDPGRYWGDNVGGSLSLLNAMVRAGCGRIVFSSTCATYGDADGVALDEDTPQHPINAYGASKKAVEHMLRDFRIAHGIRSVVFRYFNVAGAEAAARDSDWTGHEGIAGAIAWDLAGFCLAPDPRAPSEPLPRPGATSRAGGGRVL